MANQDPFASVLANPPERRPLYLRKAHIEVTYGTAFAARGNDRDHRQTVDDAVKEIQAALRLGFFAWACFGEARTATLKTDWSRQDRLGLVLSGGGLHHNVLVALLRTVLGLHHTPLAARQELERILGDDAASLSPRTIFGETVERIEIASMSGIDGREAGKVDWRSYVVDGEIIHPEGAALLEDADERIVIRGPDLPDFPPRTIGRIENRFLQICGTGLFRGGDRMDDSVNGEAEIFTRSLKTPETELVIDDYEEEPYGLLEFLNVASGGRTGALVVAKG